MGFFLREWVNRKVQTRRNVRNLTYFSRESESTHDLHLLDTSKKHLSVVKHKNHGQLCQYILQKVIKVLEAQNCTWIEYGGFYVFFSPSKKGSVCCLKTFYWTQPLTSSKGLRNLLSGCSGSVLWKAEDNLMSKWVNISFEYPSYAGLHKRQWKLKTQQLPLRNFCKSEETT